MNNELSKTLKQEVPKRFNSIYKTEMGSRSVRPTVLSLDQERKLVDCAGNRASLGTGCGKRPFLKYAKQFAEKHGAKFNQGFPTNRWWTGMKQRHAQLRLRQLECTAAVRRKCMDAVKVAKYFSVVQHLTDENKLPPASIRNMDNT